MNTTQLATSFVHTSELTMPAYLLIGSHQQLVEYVEAWLQKILCPHNACLNCATCTAIRQQQCYAVTWLLPDKQYTLEQLSPITQTLAFALEEQQKHFFIIQQADRLTPACSNSLLKSLEEPPTGYHFILLAPQVQDILPTIRSRCVVQVFREQTASIRYQKLFDVFTDRAHMQPLAFLKLLEETRISEHDTVELLDQLITFWSHAYKSALMNNDTAHCKRSLYMIDFLQKALTKPPMPGSSMLFWKNAYLYKA